MTRLLFEDVERWAIDRPDAIAVHDEYESVTYQELSIRSHQIAALLLNHGVQAGDRIAICVPKGWHAIAAMLASAKVGAPYVPLDPDSPAARIQLILEACQPAVVIAHPSAVNTVSAAVTANPDALVGTLASAQDTTWPVDPAFTEADLPDSDGIAPLPMPNIDSDDLAHVLFTSGSTGIPKGVQITHQNVISYIDWVVEHFGYTSDDQLSGHSPLHFDLSTMDIFATFAAGATLHPVPAGLNINPVNLAEWIRERNLTQWFSVPTALNHLLRLGSLAESEFPSLRRLLWCGEVLPTPTLIGLMDALPGVEFTNLYGPTEATIASSWYQVPEVPADPAASIPIGVPCAGENLLVLRKDGQPTDDEEIGDLYIEGVGLSPGYWQDEDKTAAVFRTDLLPGRRVYYTGDLAWRRSDGQVVFAGRADSQIKSRGHRIELGEIEAALETLDAVGSSAIVAIEVDHLTGSAICAAFTADAPMKPALLAKELAELVPRYMLPHRWLQLDELPTNVNGKVDRPALRTSFLAMEKS